MTSYHSSVLLKEVVEALIPSRLSQDGLALVGKESWYIDCTLGDGGHSLEILKRGGKVLGIDVDPQALERAGERLQDAGYSDQDFRLIRGNFRELENLIDLQAELKELHLIKGVVFDLGVSSLQFGSPERGFSFTNSGPLDMRMDPQLQVRAQDLILGLNKGELYELFTKLGEEKFAKRIADALVSSRQVIESTKDLARLIERVVGRRKPGLIHPATKVFQALRIAVNDELNSLREVLPKALDILESGRILVISFHSLEDRIVKNTFKSWQEQGLGQILTRKPVVPTEEEINRNPRSRSAKLRVFEKIGVNV